MRRALVAGTLLIASAVTVAAQGTDRTAWVQVVVTNDMDELVPGLVADDFRVVVAGRPQPVTDFAGTELPVSLSLMLDASRSVEPRLEEFREAVRLVVDQFRRGDRVNIGAFAGTVAVSSRFTANPARIFWTLENTLTRADTPCRAPNELRRGAAAAPRLDRTNAGTAMWDGIWCGVRQLELDREAIRKVMIVLSDGFDNASVSSEAVAMQAAQAAGVVVYTIGVSGLELQRGVGHRLLQRMSEATGGRFFLLEEKAPMAPIFARIGAELRAQYAIGFERARGGRLDVTVRRPGLTVRASRRY